MGDAGSGMGRVVSLPVLFFFHLFSLFFFFSRPICTHYHYFFSLHIGGKIKDESEDGSEVEVAG